MGTDRAWLIRKNIGANRPFDSVPTSIIGPDTDPVSVVEESRLREAEAERDKAREEIKRQNGWAHDNLRRAERLEAELREARAHAVMYGYEVARFVRQPAEPWVKVPEKDRAGFVETCAKNFDADRARGVLET